MALASTGGEAPDLRDSVCHRRGKAIAEFTAEIEDMTKPIAGVAGVARAPEGSSPWGGPAGAQAAPLMASQIMNTPRAAFEPIPVFVGAPQGWTGPIARATGDTTPVAAYSAEKEEAADEPLKPAADAQSMKRKGGRGKHAAKAASRKPVAAKAVAAKAVAAKAVAAKPASAKPAAVKQAAAKPAASQPQAKAAAPAKAKVAHKTDRPAKSKAAAKTTE